VTLLQPEALFECLDRRGVRYVLIGGLAAVLHGSPLPTIDADICPASDRENLERLAAALKGSPHAARASPAARRDPPARWRRTSLRDGSSATPSPDGLDVRICPEPPIARDEDGLMVAGRSDDHLVGRIAVKRRGQLAAFEENRWRQLGEHQPSGSKGLIHPVAHRPIEHELFLLDLLGHFPDGDGREPGAATSRSRLDRLPGLS
jgi:hypothetical protein